MLSLEEIKVVLSSILIISSPHALTIYELERDYYKQVGKKLDFQNYGNLTLEAFLRSIPDVVVISGSGSSATLRAVINPKVAHIQELITKQRNLKYSFQNDDDNNLKNEATGINCGIKSSPSNFNKEEVSISNANLNIANGKKKYVPLEIRNNIKTLMDPMYNGIPYKELPRGYKFLFDKWLDFRQFNYSSLLEMCQDLHDILYCFSGSGDEIKLYNKIGQHLPIDIQRMFKKKLRSLEQSQASSTCLAKPTSESQFVQKNINHATAKTAKPIADTNGPQSENQDISPVSTANLRSIEYASPRCSTPDNNDDNAKGIVGPYSPSWPQSVDLDISPLLPAHLRSIKSASPRCSTSDNNEDNAKGIVGPYTPSRAQSVNLDNSPVSPAHLRSIKSASPRCSTPDNNEDNAKGIVGPYTPSRAQSVDLDNRPVSPAHLRSIKSASPRCSTPDNNDDNAKGIVGPYTPSWAQSVYLDISPLLPAHLRLIKSASPRCSTSDNNEDNAKGIVGPYTPSRAQSVNLDNSPLSPAHLRSIKSASPRCSTPDNNEDNAKGIVERYTPSMTSTISCHLLSPNATEQSNKDVFIDYPSNVLKLGEIIKPQAILAFSHFHPEAEKVFVSEIYDPSKFWFTLHRLYYRTRELQGRMYNFYKKTYPEFIIPEDCLRLGLYCAVFYRCKYCRGKVVNVSLTRHLVKVFLIDYGTVAIFKTSETYFLHKDFSLFPQQAIRAKLYLLQPSVAHCMWPKQAFNLFHEYAYEKVLTASIVKVEEVVDVSLRYKTQESINNLLIQKGLAKFDHEDKHIEHVPSTLVPLVSPIHLYPTFDELEKAIVPSASEMYALLEQGLDYDDIYPHYFIKRNIECFNTSNAANLDNPNAEAFGDDYVRTSASPVNNIVNNVLINSIENTKSRILPIQSMQIQIQPIHNESFYKNYSDQMKNFIITLNKSNIEEYLRVLINTFLLEGDSQVVNYMLHLLNEINFSSRNMKEVYDYFLARYAAFSSPLHDYYLTVFFGFMDIGRLLQLYSVIQRILTDSKIPDNFVGFEMSEDNFIRRSDFMEFPIYVYNINYEVYMDFREILYIMNVKQLSVLPMMGKVNLLKFMNSLAIIVPKNNPKFLQQLLRCKINCLNKMYFIKVTFLPTLFKIMTGHDLPHSIFEAVLFKTRFSKN